MDPAPTALFSTGPTIGRLRAQIAAATGGAFGPFGRGTAVAWAADSAAARLARFLGRPLLIVEPGPLLSPYDRPETGLASLRLRAPDGSVSVHHFDPWTREPITAEACAERVDWLRARFAENRRRIVYVGMSRWKRPALDVFGTGRTGRRSTP